MPDILHSEHIMNQAVLREESLVCDYTTLLVWKLMRSIYGFLSFMQGLHLHATRACLAKLKPPLETDDYVAMTDWLDQIRQSRNAIESILLLPAQHEELRKELM